MWREIGYLKKLKQHKNHSAIKIKCENFLFQIHRHQQKQERQWCNNFFHAKSTDDNKRNTFCKLAKNWNFLLNYLFFYVYMRMYFLQLFNLIAIMKKTACGDSHVISAFGSSLCFLSYQNILRLLWNVLIEDHLWMDLLVMQQCLLTFLQHVFYLKKT